MEFPSRTTLITFYKTKIKPDIFFGFKEMKNYLGYKESVLKKNKEVDQIYSME